MIESGGTQLGLSYSPTSFSSQSPYTVRNVVMPLFPMPGGSIPSGKVLTNSEACVS
jgi:hypothetical protein